MSNYEKKYEEALDKAKAYDEAKLRMRIAFNSNRCTIGFMNEIFPELKESDDEKIRKDIIWCLKHAGIKDDSPINPHVTTITKDAIAWLKKQGESDETKAKTFLINKGYPIDANGILPTYEEMYNIIREGLEDQCEQKPQGKSALEAINEEKVDNANKAEPKFKNGQWIVWQDKCYKVNYNGCGYELVDQNGFSISLEYGTIDENAHLWDITKDAKAGDVLYSPKGAGVEGIFLIKGWEQVELTGKTLCSSIGYRVEENEIVVSGLGAIWWEGVVDPFYPATKEQRDKLEKAMADAGYTFDFEKKELKKIEDEIEIPYGAKDSELIAESYYIPKGFHAEIEGNNVVIKKGEQNLWSEGDENIKEWIMSDINKLLALNRKSFVIADKEITWLKSLKGRVGCEVNCTTTKKWKPSDEQMKHLMDAVDDAKYKNNISTNGY